MPTKPKTWTKEDMPTPTEMDGYLNRVRAVRNCFQQISGFPDIPESMDHLSIEAANNIERALLMVHETIGNIEKGRVYSGELQAGGF